MTTGFVCQSSSGQISVGDVLDKAKGAGQAVVDTVVDTATANPKLDALVLDYTALGVQGTAAVITDVMALGGCELGPGGCAAGYVAGTTVTQPLNKIADGLGFLALKLGCNADGVSVLDGQCTGSLSGLLTISGTTTPDNNLDCAIDIAAVVNDFVALVEP